ncbi:hypothetical protein KO489_05735 [Reinekea forsetii]|nr:hypothetical protein [Reinekea forsetii]
MATVTTVFALIVFVFWGISVLIHRSKVVTAKLIDINEVSEQVSMQYYSLEYFYPVATYEFVYKGKQYSTQLTSFNRFKYRQCALSPSGSKRPDADFPWRSAKVGSSIDIDVRTINPKYSYIGQWYNNRAKRELKILTALVWVALPLALVWVYEQNF